jgi:phosphoserine phosphatase
MSNEPKDLIDHMQEESRLRYGRELTPQEAGQKFMEHGLDARVNHLKALRKDETSSVRDAAKRLTMERALMDAHTAARRSGR